MNYRETVDYLYSRLPYFTRDGKSAIKKDLHNTLALCEVLGNPQHQFKSVHIAGTNGKGSTSNMLAAILQAHGYKTGLYTSPHLKDFRERIRINGEMIPEEFVVTFTEKMLPHIDAIEPSFFELTVAMCFDYFATQQVDYAIIETGLGGRLDSTNVITPLLSVITNIGMDHTDLLGDTLEKIAFEKAGIIKPRVPVVIGESAPETDEVFIQKVKETSSPIFFADKNVLYYNTEIDTDMEGPYQQKNVVTVMQAVEVLKTLGIPLEPFTVAKALMRVRDYTHFAGRWEILGHNPKIIADTGHNEHGLRIVFNQLQKEKYDKLHIVFGMVKDKDRSNIIGMLPKDAHYYFCKPDLPRGLDPDVLAAECREAGLAGETYHSVAEAYNAARSKALSNDLVYVGGSTFVVAEVI